jgi:two-component system sensor histidine kinase UhpB
VCAEAVTNALRHGSPRHCHVTLAGTGGQARLRVCDDGTGFTRHGSERGIGLTSMRQRVEALGGSLQVGARADGSGTEVVAVVPIAGQAIA